MGGKGVPKRPVTHYFFSMSKKQNPQGPGSGRVSGKEMADALADVLQEQTKKADVWRSPGRHGGERKSSLITWVVLLLLLGGSGYVWFGSPAWLAAGPPPIPPTLVEAGLRIEIFQEALRVEDFLQAEGRLPKDLTEAGDPYAGVEYQQVDPATYRLALAGPRGVVEYVSTDSLELFLGDAEQVIRTGGK